MSTSKDMAKENQAHLIYYFLCDVLKKGYLHSNDGVYEEKHSNEKADVRKSLLKTKEMFYIAWNIWHYYNITESNCRERKYKASDLEWLHKGPEQNANGVALPQQLDQPGSSEKLQETHIDGVQWLGQTDNGWREERVVWEWQKENGMQNTDGKIRHNMALVVHGGRDRNTQGNLERRNCQPQTVFEAGNCLFYLYVSFHCENEWVSWQQLTCKSTIISVMLPRTVMKSKIFQVSRK